MRAVKITPLGALVEPEGVLFRLWAPKADSVELLLQGGSGGGEMESLAQGYFERFETGLGAGELYRFRMAGRDPMPDPASRFQPRGVHGPSQVVDPGRYQWNDGDWQGVAGEDLVFYELHIGTFTAEGGFKGVARRLDYLRQLGVTAIELMPVADFPGERNWGYDQAALYAPCRAYGTPDELRALVDEAHQQGLAVFLDVCYNHFGPDGAYACAYAPFLARRHKTPWGRGVDLEGRHSPGVRNFFIDNALHWMREYHVDGLRLDATHALKDDSAKHFLAELCEAIASLPGRRRRLVAEDDRNECRLIVPRAEGGYGLDGVWSDDFHHQVHHVATGERQEYYADFAGATAGEIAETLRRGWFFKGQYSDFRQAPRGTDPSGIPLHRFVLCIQNHDQVGNRPCGDRLNQQIPLPLYRAVSALLLFAPHLVLLFMGQEWAERAPFRFFTDHNQKIGAKARRGREREFRTLRGFDGRVPDPQDRSAFDRSKLDWNLAGQGRHRKILALYSDLLELRRRLAGDFRVEAHGERGLSLRRGGHLLLAALAPDLRLPEPGGWRIELHTEEPRYSDGERSPRSQDGRVHFPSPAAAVFVREKS